MPNVHADQIVFKGLLRYLHQDGLLTAEEAKRAEDAAKQLGQSITAYLVETQLLSSETIFTCCKKNFALPLFDASELDLTLVQDPLIDPVLIRRYRVIPIKQDQSYLYLGITDPSDHQAITAISFHTGLSIQPILIAESVLSAYLQTYLQQAFRTHLNKTLSNITLDDSISQPPDKQEERDEPVIQFVNKLIEDGIIKQASDIHLESFADYCRIRFRRDGLLYEIACIPLHLGMRIILRFKIMANLNIAEKRLPQDGRFQYGRHYQDNKIDIRANTCPTRFGEKIVLRLLDTQQKQLNINALGLTNTQEACFIRALQQPQGLILVTGPTGSGKTITLYSALQHLNQIEKNIISIEDPIEIEMEGINQVNVNPSVGLHFANALRACLRQDPDILMIGEIRDCDTAETAIQAAQTGHLVLSTLHTKSAADALVRLLSMGVHAYQLIDSISLIIAQRLIRVLCTHCKALSPTSDHETYHAVGCEHCHQGYHGRIGIFELIPMTHSIAQTLLMKNHVDALSEQIKQEGHLLLWEAGLEKLKDGITTIAEITRVVGNPAETVPLVKC